MLCYLTHLESVGGGCVMVLEGVRPPGQDAGAGHGQQATQELLGAGYTSYLLQVRGLPSN